MPPQHRDEVGVEFDVRGKSVTIYECGVHCGKKRVARLMRKAGFCGVHRGRKVRTT